MFAIDKRQLLKQETKLTVNVFAMCVFLLEYLCLSMFIFPVPYLSPAVQRAHVWECEQSHAEISG